MIVAEDPARPGVDQRQVGVAPGAQVTLAGQAVAARSREMCPLSAASISSGAVVSRPGSPKWTSQIDPAAFCCRVDGA